MINDHFAAIALENKEKLLARSQKITRDNLAELGGWVVGQPRVSWVKPKAGTTAMLKVDVPMTSREFCVDLLQKTGVMMTPGDAFDMEGYVRIGYANSTDVLTTGLDKIAEYLGALPG